MGEPVAHPRAPDAENLIRRTHGDPRETQNFLTVVGKRDTRAISLE
jgi:hypothetical protein